MRLSRCAPSVRAALVTLVVAAAVVPVAAQTQEAPPDRERLTQFARAHIAINNARDEFHGKVARGRCVGNQGSHHGGTWSASVIPTPSGGLPLHCLPTPRSPASE